MGTLPPDDAPLEMAVVDVTKLGLSADEGFIVSRIVGRQVTIAELVKESGFPAHRARTAVEGLLRRGAVQKVSGRRVDPNDPYEGVVFSPGHLAEPAELTEEQRKRILFVEMNIDRWTHYKLLGLKRGATAGDIKQGYFRASKEFHPDAYFRKNLGRYQERVDRIFRAMKTAYDVLSSDEKRSTYDALLVEELTPEEEASLVKAAQKKVETKADKERQERHEARLREQRLKRNPVVDRLKRSRELTALAEAALRDKKVADAERHAKLALEYAGSDEAAKLRAFVVLDEVTRDRAASLLKHGKNLAKNGTDSPELFEEITNIAEQVVEANPLSAVILVEAARLLLRAQRKTRAVKLAQQAAELDDRLADAWEIIADVSLSEQKWAMVVRAAERWSTIAPQDARPKEMLKAAKKMLGR
jgi:hypothetical protein